MEAKLPKKILIYANEFFFVSVCFFTIYLGCNYITTFRNPYSMYFDWERKIPLVPIFIFPYLSCFFLTAWPPFFLAIDEMKKHCRKQILATFFSSFVYLLLPGKLGYDKEIPQNAFFAQIFSVVENAEGANNVLPSLHVIYGTLILSAIIRSAPKRLYFFQVWLILICLSTLLVHQHHLLDVISGFIVALAFDRGVRWPFAIRKI